MLTATVILAGDKDDIVGGSVVEYVEQLYQCIV